MQICIYITKYVDISIFLTDIRENIESRDGDVHEKVIAEMKKTRALLISRRTNSLL